MPIFSAHRSLNSPSTLSGFETKDYIVPVGAAAAYQNPNPTSLAASVPLGAFFNPSDKRTILGDVSASILGFRHGDPKLVIAVRGPGGNAQQGDSVDIEIPGNEVSR